MPGPFGGQAGGKDGTGRGTAPGPKGSGGFGEAKGGAYQGLARQNPYHANMFSGNPFKIPGSMPTAAPAAVPNPTPAAPAPVALQDLFSQHAPGLMQYLIGQVPNQGIPPQGLVTGGQSQGVGLNANPFGNRFGRRAIFG